MTPPDFTLLFTDIVDSTAVNSRLGDAGMAALWDAHDGQSRELLRRWNGREVDRSDGFLLLFERCSDAVAYCAAYHQALARLPVPLAARAGIHVGPLTLRETPAAEVALGAKPVEVLGIAKAIGARVMALARAGQTLLSPSARAALADEGGLARWQCMSHGHWQLKGLDPMEVFEVGTLETSFLAPLDTDRARRVVLVDGQWLPLQEVPHTLPAEREPIVGRLPEVRLLQQQLQGGSRLVTITGAGGMGKTRLALRYAWSALADNPGGVWFCDLSSARELDGLLYAVGQGLDVPLGKDPITQLGRAIAGRGRCLVVLDNFEQVRRHARETLGKWLDTASQARFLATSREVLGLSGEHTLGLLPLSVDEGTQLFHQRAMAAHAAHDPSAHVEETRQLVSLLDGMPLAIELAAPRVRVMPPPLLLARMGDRFRLLSAGDGRPDRQATLRATLAWSWDLLASQERATLAQLTVFQGGFNLTAAQAVVELPDEGGGVWLLDVLQSLVEKSLLTPMAHGRFGLLRSVQEFAGEQLQAAGAFPGSGPAGAAGARRRHHRHHASLSTADATAHGCVELDNLVCACREAVRHGDADDAVACLRLAWAALKFTGPYQTSAALAEQVRVMPGLGGSQVAEAERLLALTLRDQGANAAARAAAERGLAACHDEGSASLRAGLHGLLAETALISGDFDASGQLLLDAALALALEGDDPTMLCTVYNTCALRQQVQGHIAAAREFYRQGLAMAESHQLRRWQGGFLGNLAGLDYADGRLDDARQMYERALTVHQELGNRQWQGDAHSNLGLIHLELGQLDEAETHLLAALARAQELGYARLAHTANCNLGLLFRRRGQLHQAADRLAMAVEGAQMADDVLSTVLYMAYLAPAQALDGHLQTARETLALASSLLPAGADAQTRGLLACAHCEVEHCAGVLGAAQAALQEAQQLLEGLGAGGEASELARGVAHCLSLLQASEGEVVTPR